MDSKQIEHGVKLLATLVGILLMLVGNAFSVVGVNFVNPQLMWLGLALVAAITPIEIIWNQEGMQHGWRMNIFTLGFVYPYDIITNVLGLAALVGFAIAPAAGWAGVTFEYVFTLFVLCFVGIGLAIVPEYLMVWGVFRLDVNVLFNRAKSYVDGRGKGSYSKYQEERHAGYDPDFARAQRKRGGGSEEQRNDYNG